MRLALKLALLAAMALTALAMTATSAAAQETGVEVSNEATGLHCNPCEILVEGNSTLSIPGGGVVSACHDTFEAEVFEDGTGHIPEHTLEGPDCIVTPCVSAGESEWPILAAGEVGPGVEHITVDFCLEPAGGGDESHCVVEVDVTDLGNHTQQFSVAGHLCPIGLVLDGTWTVVPSASHDRIEIAHL